MLKNVARNVLLCKDMSNMSLFVMEGEVSLYLRGGEGGAHCLHEDEYKDKSIG